jgi:hypothetical protein
MSASTSTCWRIKVALDEPFTRQLRGKLRELRFHVGREQVRIILLTVFRKTRQRERAEIDRAWQAMRVCIAGHLGEKAE